jgi:hypothetical protein
MNALSTLYSKFLEFGLLGLREAIRCQDCEWAEAEVEFLHNIPSLLDEPNEKRHLCFWFAERERYIEWVDSAGRDRPKSRLRTYYEPIWREMEPIIQSLAPHSGARSA